MPEPIIVVHWRTVVDPPELVDGTYHVIYTGVYAPSTPCGIHRGRPPKTWHEEESPVVELRCETCVASLIPENTDG